MVTPENFFFVLGWIMVVCVTVFFLADSRIPWEKIVKKIAVFLAIGIIVLFFGSMIVDFIPEK
jgi:hypothetical protein